MIVGNLVAGKRIAQACGRDVAQLEDNDQAREAEPFPRSSAPAHLEWGTLLSSAVCGRTSKQPGSDLAASFFQPGCNKTRFFRLFSSCTYKTCCSGEHRPLQITLSLWFLTLRYCSVPPRFASSRACESGPDPEHDGG